MAVEEGVPKAESVATGAENTRSQVHRILAIDGGQSALLTILMLEQIEEQVPGFLARTDLFAGTSSGGITALTLASRDNPVKMLSPLRHLWTIERDLFTNTPLGFLAAVVGIGALLETSIFQAYLEREELLGHRTLGDLKKHVAIAAFRVNSLRFGPHVSPRPKIFHNTGAPGDPDLRKLASEVALSTSAFPIGFPAYQGAIDGGTFANNPAMVGVAQIQKAFGDDTLSQVRVLSLGDGISYPNLNAANWGYCPWLFAPWSPLLLVNTLMRGSVEAVNYQCRHVLARNAFFRLDPTYLKPGFIPFLQTNARKLHATANSPSTRAQVSAAVQWVRDCGWMEEGGQN